MSKIISFFFYIFHIFINLINLFIFITYYSNLPYLSYFYVSICIITKYMEKEIDYFGHITEQLLGIDLCRIS